ncbi:MAG: Crp/Fnr family transcriptional regulator [Flavobacteriales bacterium]|nr:Crp/Fnr family transcriptional regulator [Flavobacteriales bacterium]
MLKEHLRTYGVLTEEDLSELDGITYTKQLRKNDFFVREGEVSKEVGFVLSGQLRSFYYSSNGDEVTYCFRLPNSFVSAYASLITKSPSEENLQALSDVELTCISRENFYRLEENNANWMKFSKMVAQMEYMNLEKRIFLLQRESAEKRYADLLKNEPELLRLVSLDQLSSYLGVTPRHLSRIRGLVAK